MFPLTTTKDTSQSNEFHFQRCWKEHIIDIKLTKILSSH